MQEGCKEYIYLASKSDVSQYLLSVFNIRSRVEDTSRSSYWISLWSQKAEYYRDTDGFSLYRAGDSTGPCVNRWGR